MVFLRALHLFLLAIPACLSSDPVPREQWAAPDDPLSRTAVWVQRDGSWLDGSAEMKSLVRPGNSGSPVFVDGRLAGIITKGLFDAEESPPDVFLELVFLRIGTVRVWLERNGLHGLLDDRG